MYGKIMIFCKLKVITGMHIGTSSAFSAIGAVDSPVIRDAMTQRPIVPGSSLKGKMRTLLARSLCKDVNKMPSFDADDPVILRMFGSAKPVRRSRLQFSDCFVENEKQFEQIGLTEVKTENGINRLTAVANPRQIERVVPGVEFGVRIIYDVMQENEVLQDMETLARAMKLLQLDYLGGHGSRGSGRVALHSFRIETMDANIETAKLKAVFDQVENYELLPV